MSQHSQQEFARRLRALRRARGLTQRQLAGDTLSVSYVSLLEAGRRTPTEETVHHLARALDCSPEELRGGEDNPVTRPAALNVRFGQLALEAGEVEQAQALFEAVLNSSDLDPLIRTEAFIGVARTLENQGRLREAATAYERLVQEAIRSPRYVSSLHVVISWCRCLYELGELTRVVEVGTGAMRELDRLNAWQSDTAVQLLATVAAAHFELGEVPQAERLLREGLERAEHMRSPRARASVLWNASHVASEDGRHREALELAEEALAYFRHAGDQRAVGRLLSQYGLLLLRQDPPRVADAQQMLEEGLAILTETGHAYDRGYILTELSRAHLMQGDAKYAVELAERSLAELGPEAALERARAETVLAAAHAALGEQDRAAEIFDRAAGTLRELRASRQAARAWVELGNMLDEAGNSAAAVRAFREATSAVNLAGHAGVAHRRELPAGD
jgi:tetratricopeptide (TPR) repeat protein